MAEQRTGVGGRAQAADIALRDVSVRYPSGVVGLDSVTLTIPAGEMVGIVGLSGAGKSTLIRAVNGLVRVSSGEVRVGERVTSRARGRELRRARAEIGMIFQSFNLATRTSVLNNVMVGRLHAIPWWRSLIAAWPAADVDAAFDALERVDIAQKAYAKASELSGGQQQRVAIARALAQQPRIMLADEPVASLDPPTSHVVMRDLQRINRDLGITVVTNLHFLDLARTYCDRLIGLRRGQVVYDGPSAGADEAVFTEIYGRSLTADDVLEGRAEL